MVCTEQKVLQSPQQSELYQLFQSSAVNIVYLTAKGQSCLIGHSISVAQQSKQTSFIAQFPKFCTSAILSCHSIQAFNCLCLKVSKSSTTLTKSPDANSPRLGGRYGAPISEVRRSSIQNIHIQSVIKWATTYKQSPWTYQELVNGRSNNNNIQQQKLCTLSQPEHT